jgi:hypothetical protein
MYAVNFKAHYLTQNDIVLLKQIKEYGQKYDLSYSLMAIAVKESSIGRYKVNVDSFDYGLYQANINTVIRRHNMKNSSSNRNKVAMMLINDFDFATSNAIAELVYWKKVHRGNWEKVWSSYNAGWNFDSSRGKRYSKDIIKIIKELKKVDLAT